MKTQIHQYHEEDQLPWHLGIDQQYYIDDHRSDTRYDPVHIIGMSEELRQHRYLVCVEDHRRTKYISKDSSTDDGPDITVEIRE